MFEVKLFISFFMVVGNAKDKFFVLLASLQPFLHGDNLINILPLNSMLHEVDALFIVSEFAFRGEGVEEYKECVDGTFLSLSEILEFIVGLLFSSVVFEDSNELGPQLIQTKPIFHVFLDPLINRVRQSRDFNFDSDLFSSCFRFRFHLRLASASRRSFTAVCKQVAKLPFWETQQGFANDCSSLNIARIYTKYKIFAIHSMTLRFSSPIMVQKQALNQ